MYIQSSVCNPRLSSSCTLPQRDLVNCPAGEPLPRNMTSHSAYQFMTAHTCSLQGDFSGFEAGPLAEHLSNHTPIPIPYKPPFDYAGWTLTAVGGLAFLLTLRFISPILQSRWTWAAGSIVTMLVMVSGFMFTRIRGSPFTGGDGSWIAAGYQNQYGQEVQVIAMICECLTPMPRQVR